MNGRITDAVEVGTGQSAEEATVHGKEKVSTVPPVVSPVPTSAGVRRIVYISRLTRVLDPELTAGALGGSLRFARENSVNRLAAPNRHPLDHFHRRACENVHMQSQPTLALNARPREGRPG